MSTKAGLRPWLSATRCMRRSQLSVLQHRRNVFTSSDQPFPLQSPDDWQLLQDRRIRFKMLVDLFSKHGSNVTRDNAFQPHHQLHRPLAPSEATLSALIAAGAHFGHSKSLLNPNFMPYAYGVRAGITIIDLDSTLPLLRRAANLTRAIVARDGTVVFVGTRPDLRAVVRKAAERIGPQAFHVGERWLPGTLTNKLQLFGSDVAKEQRVTPDLVIFLNPLANIHAIRECAIQHIPTIGIVDSNVDPRVVMYAIPANDESPRAAELIAGVLSIAGREGRVLREREEQSKELQRSQYMRAQERGTTRYVADRY
ncbi:ribosomal protein S2, flavodoxin-like domain-containing protein [Suillus subalutaceus]|uniref:ribosomal protein S2, flavodoxin-like domain-containing protein n=1 Tax=Suillus subalutaceus TaxID=48586 RepID=UPI001B8722A1|nr:ribosomal protein S2, flavodoxin-like domain-containing protein [Suillus subalutaceus]KAG1877776.1 ribosomal protein S2, flavodoxin-like domain-containing protein [Suillus subalutaceus]KAG1891346.1 ribosomal protein S2, flavodoxin-like domain-containing protein [Suillus subluteus]